jgi:CheY-like chemotaxis protein
MAQLALIDDDPVEAMVIGGLLEHLTGGHTLQSFLSVEAFNQEDPNGIDLVLLDRRIPPHQSFDSSLKALSASAYHGPVVLITAGGLAQPDTKWRGELHGPVDKGALLTPTALSKLITAVLAPDRPVRAP